VVCATLKNIENAGGIMQKKEQELSLIVQKNFKYRA
jgi:hypothetical protein